MINKSEYIISGQVVHKKSNKGIPGLRVEAYDKDYITKDDYYLMTFEFVDTDA